MFKRCGGLAWTLVLIEALWVNAATPAAPAKKTEMPTTGDLPLDKLPAAHKQAVFQVLDKPTLAVKGPSETFYGRAEHYRWFLDHPDRAVVAWRRLGAKCVSIEPRGDGQFGWTDEHGSEIVWKTVFHNTSLRLWYAEGKVRPAPLMPLFPVKALVVMRHSASQADDGAAVVQHQTDLFVHTDSKTAAVMTRLLGPSAQRAAEQGLGQMQFFFSGLCWYLERHPDEAEDLLKE